MSERLSWFWMLFGVLLILGTVAAMELAQVQTMQRAGTSMMQPFIASPPSLA